MLARSTVLSRLALAAAAACVAPAVLAQTDPATPAAPAAAPATAAPAATAPAAPADPAAIEQALKATPVLLDAAGIAKGNAVLKGKRFYIAEYRVLFEVSGRVTANTRAAYFGGRDYGATRVSVNYEWKQPDLQLMQAITDKAYADFLARMDAAGLKPEPIDAFVQANGAVYETKVEPTKPGAEVYEEVDLGYGKRKYMVFAPTGTRTVERGFIGLGAGNIGKRIDFSKGNMEGVSVGMVVNLAAQESSGGGSSMFKRGSSANASAAMEVGVPPKQFGVLQTHATSQAVQLTAPLAVPGQFADLREVGGYDTQKDAVVQGIQMLGRLTMGLAGNNSKKVDMALEVDGAALAKHALQGMVSTNQMMVGAIQ
ncbi:hypothetical protein FN976_01610 [Caenimonas sedimenti]|uniref:Uncharacterized protein n=1 Tax=Caenimonas sedimenti TaxID=2596921 RepID=A0A562ZXE5_9BURK|nr:hypothetical protein [Caenimonas sedimenti]TWO72965.1 hypothetical protein FN976_01610 [Caenimonas sedimenti]